MKQKKFEEENYCLRIIKLIFSQLVTIELYYLFKSHENVLTRTKFFIYFLSIKIYII